MDLQTFLYNVLLIIISFVVPIATTYVVKFLQVKVGNENLKKYLNMAETAVKAAEQLFPAAKSGAEKKAAVEKYLHEQLGDFFTIGEIDQLIEAAVFEISETGKKVIYDTPAPYQSVSPFSYPLTCNDIDPCAVNPVPAAPDIPTP